MPRVTSETNAPQAPTLGRMQRWLGPLYFNSVFWYRFQFWAGTNVPHWFLSIMSRIMSTFFFVLLHEVRRSLRKNHQLVDPSLGWWAATWRAYRTVHTFTWCVTERNQQLVGSADFQMTYEGRENWDAEASTGSGAIVVTSHIGGWEISSALASSEDEKRAVHVVREREVDPAAQEFIAGLMARGDNFKTHFADEGQQLVMDLYCALRDGDVVALQGDRPRKGGQVERVEFLGTTVSLPRGPAQLARLADVPILPVFTFREGTGRYRIVFREAIRVARTANRKQDVHDAVQTLAGMIESAIREAPEQWFCFSDIRGYEGAPDEPVDSTSVAQTA